MENLTNLIFVFILETSLHFIDTNRRDLNVFKMLDIFIVKITY